MKRYFIVLLLCNSFILPYSHLFGQENNWWPLGNLGSAADRTDNNWMMKVLDFRYEPPILDSISDTLTFGNSSQGKFTSICDSTGGLLFYNGQFNVYDKEQNKIFHISKKWSGIMSNSILLPDPSDPNIVHFINANHGLFDAQFQKKPKSVLLKIDTLVKSIPDTNMHTYFPNIEVIKMKYNKGYWIVANNSIDTFYVFSLTPGGIKFEHKQISKIYSSSNYLIHSSNSALQSSHDGKLLVFTYRSLRSKLEAPLQSGVIFFDFDAENGTLSNGREVLKDIAFEYYETRRDSFTWYKFDQYENSAFSPNDSIIYILNRNLRQKDSTIIPAPIIQFDRYKEEIIAEIPLKKSHAFGGIQLAPNGKIYFGASDFFYYTSNYISYYAIEQCTASIGLIEFPDARGLACNVLEEQYVIPNTVASIYFPNVIYNFRRVKFKTFQGCDSLIHFQNLSDPDEFESYRWYFSDKDSMSGLNATYAYPHSGKYLVKLRAATPAGFKVWWSDSVTYLKPPQSRFETQKEIGCQHIAFHFYDKSNSDTIKNNSDEKWTWFFGDGNSISYTARRDSVSHIYTQSGLYNVKLIYSNGFCSDTFIKMQEVEILPAPKPGFSTDKQGYCSPAQVQIQDLSVGEVSSFYYVCGTQSSSNRHPTLNFEKPGTYTIIQRLTSPSTCVTEDSLMLTIHQGISENDIPEILYATHVNNDTLELAWNKISGAKQYFLTNEFNHTQRTVALTVDTSIIVLYYKGMYCLQAVDSCGNISAKSCIQPMRLNIELNQDEDALLNWSAYKNWQPGVENYEVYERQFNNWEKIAETQDTTFLVRTLFDRPQMESCFYISANNKDKSHLKAKSNTVCVHPKSRIWAPNAFSPNNDQLNDHWELLSVSIKNIEVKIYNIWGEEVWRSEGDSIRWDGRFRGNILPEGIYYFTLKARTMDEDYIYRKGNLLLIK